MLTGNLERIVEHGKRADNIVKSMLAHSRSGGGDRQSVDLNALVEESLNLAYHGARAQDQNFNITLERDYGSDIAPVESRAARHDARVSQPVRQRLLCREQAPAGGKRRGVQTRADSDDARSRQGRRGAGARQRHRHSRRHQGQTLPAVLHHEADRRRHRARTVDQLRDRHQAAWRDDQGRQRSWSVHRIHRKSAAPLHGQGGGRSSSAASRES